MSLFRHVPKGARRACWCLALIALMYAALLASVLVSLIRTRQALRIDWFAMGLGGTFACLTLGAVLATILLAKGRPAGRPLAWIVVVPAFLMLTIGTVLAAFAVSGLGSPEMDEYLSRTEKARRGFEVLHPAHPDRS